MSQYTVRQQLESFRIYRTQLIQSHIADPHSAEDVIVVSGNGKRLKTSKKFDLMLIGTIHGNETAGLAILNRIAEKLVKKEMAINFKAVLALGNTEAALRDVRFVEKDMNRIFGQHGHSTIEDQRARLLEPYLSESQFLLDIHQTIQPTRTPFFIFGFEPKAIRFSRELSPATPIVNYASEDRKSTGLPSTVYSLSNGNIATTIELGQKGFHQDQINEGIKISKRAIELVNRFCERPDEWTIWQNIEIDPETRVLRYAHKIPNDHPTCELEPGFTNFMQIQKGQLLGRSINGPILSPIDGQILFPKYGQSKNGSAELCILLESVPVKHYA